MSIVIILPRGMRFSADRATAIDLCVHDFVRFSQFQSDTVILGEKVALPFQDVNFHGLAPPTNASHKVIAQCFAEAARKFKPRLIVVHQHVPIGAEIARLIAPIPVILHKHNFHKKTGIFKRFLHQNLYSRFERTIWVSDKTRKQFCTQFQKLAPRAARIHNGIDCSSWHPKSDRNKAILVVGRATPEKGIVQAAEGIASILVNKPDWNTHFIMSRHDHDNQYLELVEETLAPLKERAILEVDKNHAHVQSACETAAIAVVPSVFAEPFGRTAIEAMAGGAALISSTRGGLSEIVNESGIPLKEITPLEISKALLHLIDDEAALKRVAAAGRKKCEDFFDIRNVTTALDNVYRSILSDR